MYDLIIIGSGPAGLSAAVYGKRAGLNLLIIEEKPMSGGQILNTYEVDNYLGLPGISGFDMGMTFRIMQRNWERSSWRLRYTVWKNEAITNASMRATRNWRPVR